MNNHPDTPHTRLPGEVTVLWVIWLTYGSFYFCRQNISAAVPGMRNDGLSPVQVGYILGALKVAYAVGQLVNGQLAERFSARRLLAFGMIGSALLNIAFGFAEGLYFLIFIWACNGYCQSLGWTPCVRVAANWIPVNRRGRVLGVIGTSYQFMASVTYLVAGACVQAFGWRGAFFLPAVLLIAAAVHMLVFLRETPEAATGNGANTKTQLKMSHVFALTITNVWLWVLAVTLFLMDACRYFYQDWGLAHLAEVQGSSVWKSAAQYSILPAGGIAGALFGGWVTDRFFHGRRAPVIFANLLLLAGLTFLYGGLTRESPAGVVVVLLFWIGFGIFGSQVLLVGTAPTDFARAGTAAAAAGFVNFMGYMGAFTGDAITGHLKEYYNWEAAIQFWGWVALAAALVILLLWRVGPHTKR